MDCLDLPDSVLICEAVFGSNGDVEIIRKFTNTVNHCDDIGMLELKPFELCFIPNKGWVDDRSRVRNPDAAWAVEASWKWLEWRIEKSAASLAAAGKHTALECILGASMLMSNNRDEWHRQAYLLAAAELYW